MNSIRLLNSTSDNTVLFTAGNVRCPVRLSINRYPGGRKYAGMLRVYTVLSLARSSKILLLLRPVKLSVDVPPSVGLYCSFVIPSCGRISKDIAVCIDAPTMATGSTKSTPSYVSLYTAPPRCVDNCTMTFLPDRVYTPNIHFGIVLQSRFVLEVTKADIGSFFKSS